MVRRRKSMPGELEYIQDAERQMVKLSLRRPLFFNVPENLQEFYDPKKKIRAPTSTLELEWVHGYRGRDSRNNIFLLDSGEVVYFVAAVAVIYNHEDNTQRHYIGHTDDIKSLAVHPDGITVATGQTCGRDRQNDAAHVRIWSATTLETLFVIGKGVVNRCVNALAFSKEDEGGVLAVVDDATEPRMSLWKWADEEMITESKVSADPILSVYYSNESPSRIVTAGKNHLAFWAIDSDSGHLARRMGLFGTHEKPKYLTAVAFSPEYQETITGDSSGNLMVWKSGGNTVTSEVTGAHEGAIFSIYLTEENYFISGGKDRRIVEYSHTLEPTGRETTIPEEYGAPRQILLKDDTLIVGTTRNAVVKGSFDGEFETITQGHLEELWGISPHPSESKFVTAGLDGMLFMRDLENHSVEWSKDMEHSCKSATFSPGGEVIVVGTTTGKWMVVRVEDQEIVFNGQDGDEAIQTVKFSPDGTMLALGSRDNNAYIYTVEDDYTAYSKHGECEGHSSFIRQVDWSSCGQYLQTNSGDYEHLFWDIQDDCSRMDKDDTTNLTWHTNSCLLSFYTVGIWPEGVDGTDVNGCNKANSHDIIATGDDFGKVKLFKFPASYEHMKYREYGGHSSHVTLVHFSHDDAYLVSAGGRDTSTMQWKVTNEDEPPEEDNEEEE